MKLCLILAALALTVTMLTGCKSTGSGEASTAPEKVDYGKTMEARQFFADPNCIVYTEGVPRADLQKLVDDCYRLGAPNIFFAGLIDGSPDETPSNKKMSAWIVAEIPASGDVHTKIVKRWSDFYVSLGEDPIKDEGQSHLSLELD